MDYWLYICIIVHIVCFLVVVGYNEIRLPTGGRSSSSHLRLGQLLTKPLTCEDVTSIGSSETGHVMIAEIAINL